MLVGSVALACSPNPQVATPTPGPTPTATQPKPPSQVEVVGPGVAEIDLRARLCGTRAPCGLRRTRAAGVDAGGQALAVVSVELGAGQGEGAGEGLEEEAWVDSFSAAPQGKCASIEYWLVVGDPRAPTATTLLLHVCNEGNGAAGLGEDTVTIGVNSLEYTSSGGSNWRWDATRRIELAPLRVREVSSSGSWVMGPNRQQHSWSFDRFAGASSWYSPPCDPESGEPIAVEEAAQIESVYSPIPAVAIDAAFTTGWQALGLGRCALTLTAAERPADATLRVVAAGATLYVELEDDEVTNGDRLELWLADAGASYMDHCLGAGSAGLRQWSIGARDGRVTAGHGRPEPAALAVERSGTGPVRMRLTPRGGFAALSVVYVDRDAGERTPLRLASSALVPGRAETLGRLEAIDAAAASCAVTAGRLEPVLHAFVGPGPVLR